MTARMEWQRDGADWSNRDASRFVMAAGMRWHVQVMGSGPVLLLLHGTGAATHSWRALMPLLAADFTVVAPDLPGHAFTDMPDAGKLTLPGMARAVRALLRELGVEPRLALGHSAGAAVAVRMALDGLIDPEWIVSLNGALLPLRGMPARIFSPAAKVLASWSAVPRIFAFMAGEASSVARLIRDTGSSIDARGLALYGRLVRNPGHVAGALGMMANWQLNALEADLPALKQRLLLVAGRGDRTISPAEALRVRNLVPGARLELLAGLGHLAHEEQPGQVAALVRGLVYPQPAQALA